MRVLLTLLLLAGCAHVPEYPLDLAEAKKLVDTELVGKTFAVPGEEGDTTCVAHTKAYMKAVKALGYTSYASNVWKLRCVQSNFYGVCKFTGVAYHQVAVVIGSKMWVLDNLEQEVQEYGTFKKYKTRGE